MSVTSSKYIVQNMERISFFDLETGACDFVIEDLQNAEMTNGSEVVYATGKNGARLAAFDRNKTSSISATNGTIVDGVLAVQVGDEVDVATHTVPNEMFAIATTNGTDVTLTVKPIGDTGSEIAYIYKRNGDGTLGEKYPIAATATATAFSYSAANKKITLPTGKFQANDIVVMFYDVEVENSKLIRNYENKFSKTGRVVADAFFKDVCTDKSYFGKIVYYKAKASGEWNLTFGDDPSVQNVSFEALTGGCNGTDGAILWDIFIYDEDDRTTLGE